uniref:KH_dom_type_1 domain-containing protein n=1 Tax=Macrostomum lignano TaxID=282301 RepID=A0A1I8F985_9PLAT
HGLPVPVALLLHPLPAGTRQWPENSTANSGRVVFVTLGGEFAAGLAASQLHLTRVYTDMGSRGIVQQSEVEHYRAVVLSPGAAPPHVHPLECSGVNCNHLILRSGLMQLSTAEKLSAKLPELNSVLGHLKSLSAAEQGAAAPRATASSEARCRNSQLIPVSGTHWLCTSVKVFSCTVPRPERRFCGVGKGGSFKIRLGHQPQAADRARSLASIQSSTAAGRRRPDPLTHHPSGSEPPGRSRTVCSWPPPPPGTPSLQRLVWRRLSGRVASSAGGRRRQHQPATDVHSAQRVLRLSGCRSNAGQSEAQLVGGRGGRAPVAGRPWPVVVLEGPGPWRRRTSGKSAAQLWDGEAWRCGSAGCTAADWRAMEERQEDEEKKLRVRAEEGRLSEWLHASGMQQQQRQQQPAEKKQIGARQADRGDGGSRGIDRPAAPLL